MPQNGSKEKKESRKKSGEENDQKEENRQEKEIRLFSVKDRPDVSRAVFSW
jgi:hypothetical protein